MKKSRLIMLALTIVAAVAMSTGCSNKMDSAIKKLGGTEAEQKEAMDIILVDVPDPMPDLKAALKDTGKTVDTRKNVAMMIGVVAERTGDDSVVDDMVEAMKGAEPEVMKAIVSALEKIPGTRSRTAVSNLMDSDDPTVAKMAWDIIDAKAREKEAQADAMSGEASYNRKIELLKEAYKINPRNKDIMKKLAGFYAIRGEMGKARELYEAGGKFLPAIKVVGPFPMDQDESIIDPSAIDTTSPVTAGEESLAWFDFTDVPEYGLIDFRKNQATKQPKSVYFATFKIEADSTNDLMMQITSKEALKLWINGEEVIDLSAKEAKSKDEHEIALNLKKGTNKALLMLKSKKRATFSIRICDKDRKKTNAIAYGL